MARIETALANLGSLNDRAAQDTPIHRLDPRVKLLVTLAFTVTVLSFDKYQVLPLIPFALYPMLLMVLGNIPLGFLGKRLLLAAPFALFVGIFNPFLDQEIMLRLGPVALSGGWISFSSIVLRFLLVVSAALILVASTGMENVCGALVRLKVPRVLAVQILLMYRYLFVLIEEAVRMLRAHALRSFHHNRLRLSTFGSLAGQLLLRTLDRAQRIHMAMCCRGYSGELRLSRPLTPGNRDLLFVLGWAAFFILARCFDLSQLLGGWLVEVCQ